MVNVIKDSRTWKVQPVMDNEDCPHLYYPHSIHGCRLGLEKACWKDTCPIRVKGVAREEQIV
jgi:hypothetical protein